MLAGVCPAAYCSAFLGEIMINCIQLLRNIGKFDSVNSGARLPFDLLTLIYAENGRGKTTLAAMFRSLRTGVADHILNRHRLAAANPPHIVVSLTGGGANCVFENGAWLNTVPDIVVFDDLFVAENVCSGIEVVATRHFGPFLTRERLSKPLCSTASSPMLWTMMTSAQAGGGTGVR